MLVINLFRPTDRQKNSFATVSLSFVHWTVVSDKFNFQQWNVPSSSHVVTFVKHYPECFQQCSNRRNQSNGAFRFGQSEREWGRKINPLPKFEKSYLSSPPSDQSRIWWDSDEMFIPPEDLDLHLPTQHSANVPNKWIMYCVFKAILNSRWCPQMSVCPQLKDIQFTVMEEERNQKIFMFKKLKSEDVDIKDDKLMIKKGYIPS